MSFTFVVEWFERQRDGSRVKKRKNFSSTWKNEAQEQAQSYAALLRGIDLAACVEEVK